MRVLPADVYDTLEFSALVFKGIGAGSFYFGDAPLCYVGHLAASGAVLGVGVVRPFDIDEEMSDSAVFAINRRKKVNQFYRVSWKEYTQQLGIVRGVV